MDAKDEYECIASLLIVSEEEKPVRNDDHERKRFGPWFDGDLFAQLNSGKGPGRSKIKEAGAKGPNPLKFDDRTQRKDPKREGVSTYWQSRATPSPSFSHFDERSEYIKGYKDLKSKLIESNADVRPVRLYQGVPTTQIILNSASAITRPRTNSNAYCRSGSCYSTKSVSSENIQEQFVLCSPTKVVTYDCTPSHVRSEGSYEVLEQKPKATIQKKIRKKLIRADLNASAKTLCVNGIGESQRGLSNSAYERRCSRMRLDTFPVQYPTGKHRIVTENLPKDFYLTGCGDASETWDSSRRNTGNFQYNASKPGEEGKVQFGKQDSRHYTLSAIS